MLDNNLKDCKCTQDNFCPRCRPDGNVKVYCENCRYFGNKFTYQNTVMRICNKEFKNEFNTLTTVVTLESNNKGDCIYYEEEEKNKSCYNCSAYNSCNVDANINKVCPLWSKK